MHVVTEDGPTSFQVTTGMTIIVPQGTWHRFGSPESSSIEEKWR